MKLNMGPAITTEILDERLASLNEMPFASLSDAMPSSPSITQAPPIGSNLSENLVPDLVKEKIVGPIPMENSITFIPLTRANIKCPNSWDIISTDNININHKIETKV